MVNTINWVPPTNTSVGSVLIYRANDFKTDSLGSRTLITTIGARSGSDWVVSYSDAGGTVDSLYRIQFWDGVGSSELSDAIGQQYSEQLATFDDVLRLARLKNYYDIGSDIVYDSIRNATEDVFFKYGDPVKKTAFYLDSETGVIGQAYNFTGDLGPVYQVREVFVDEIYPDIVPSTSYQIDYGQGVIKFTDEFIGSWNGKNVYVHWVPAITNVLVKHMAALELVQGELVLNGPSVTNPQVERLEKRIVEIKNTMRPQGVFSTKSFSDLDNGYDFIPQKTERKNIYFNY